jgi:transcription initiation factor TFIIH subunit 4
VFHQFLETNAHPQMKQNSPVIPESIADQLRLWEAEDRRLTLDAGYFYDDFASCASSSSPPPSLWLSG